MKKIIIALYVLISCNLFAQQDAEFSFYMYNGTYINPAYAGSRDVISATALYRHQWTKMNGAPRSFSVGVHSPLRNERHALGINFLHDQHGVTKSDGVNAMYAFRVPLGKSKKSKLCFGIQAGITNYNETLTDLGTDQNGDPVFGSNQSYIIPNVGAGIYLYGEKYYAGFSVPHLLNISMGKPLVVTEDLNDARQYRHYLLTAGYVFNLSKQVDFKPSFLMKAVNGAPIQFDITAAFLISKKLWLSASHRTGDSYVFGAAYNFTPQFRLGYAYDLTVSDLTGYSGGTHELMLGYDFWFEKSRMVNPRYVKYF